MAIGHAPMNSASPLLATGIPVLVTLFTGLLIAFAVQLLLTTFGIAAGITALGYLPGRKSDPAAPLPSDPKLASDSEPSMARGVGTANKIGFAVGAGTLLTVNTVLLVACWLAVKLSLVDRIMLGAILGVVIWSGYVLILFWFSTKAAGSIMGVLAGAMSAGVQGLIATVGNALKPDKDADRLSPALDQRLAATESHLATMQTQMAANQRTLEATLQDYLQTLPAPQLDLSAIRQDVARVLASSGLPSVAHETSLSRLDRQALVDLVSRRTDFSQQDVAQVVEQLEGVWQEVMGAPDPIADVTAFLQSASPEALTPDAINARLHQLRSHIASPTSTRESSAPQTSGASLEPAQLIKRLVRVVRDRVDLSDIDVGTVLQHVQSLLSPEASESPDVFTNPFTGTIQADVETYLLTADPWHLTHKTVKAEFEDVIYDPDANPVAVRRQLLPIDRTVFVALLQQRDDLSPARINTIADRLVEVRQVVLKTLDAAIANASVDTFSDRVADYLRSAKKATLKPTSMQKQIKALLQATTVDVDAWDDHLHALGRDRIAAALADRSDLDEAAIEHLTTQLESVRDRLLDEAQTAQAALASEATTLWQQFGEFVRDRNQKLTARTVQRQVKALAKATKNELASLRHHLPPLDLAVATQWLVDRQDLSEKQIQRILKQLEKAWDSLLQLAQAAINVTNAGSHHTVAVFADYLQTIDIATMNAVDVSKDLLHCLHQHAIEGDSLAQLTSLDWEPLIQQVQQRQDLTTAQQQQVLHQFQKALYTIGKLPRRLALRAQRQTQSWQDMVSDYLRYAERDDLQGDRVAVFLQQLWMRVQTGLTEPEHWLETLQHDLPTQRDRAIALLLERGDLTEAEVNQTVERLEQAVRQVGEQAHALKQQAQATVATALDNLQHYIASLPLPELDYDRVKHDLQQLLVDPRAGIETLSDSVGTALRDQLSALNRQALERLINTRTDISDGLARQLTDRIDALRLGAIAQIDTLQHEAQHRLEDLRQQAQRQANETRKAVATAAWWLFLTALSSVITAAIAGAVAVGGWEWVAQVVGLLRMGGQ